VVVVLGVETEPVAVQVDTVVRLRVNLLVAVQAQKAH
jgi:hypothetical protein